MKEYRIVYTDHVRARMVERNISEEEITHVLLFGLSTKKNENAGRFPKEEISCLVGSRLIHAVVAINHTSRVKVVITAYAKGRKR
jgi:hypothetical protein